MTFLPIVDRELRASSRRRGTYWTRVLVALVSLVLGVGIFLSNLDEPDTTVGPRVFLGLSIIALCYCLLAGRRLTVDSLTEEKREGTLGLLFLTDLKGHDVIMGKLAATSLNGFFSLLALLPVLAVPLLMGGISSGQFWRMALVLVISFLFSLAVGIFASAAQPSMRRAAAVNLLLLGFFTVGLPLVVLALSYLGSGGNGFAQPPWEMLCTSPIFAFIMSLDAPFQSEPAIFWLAIGLIHSLTWLLIYFASLLVPCSWQERVTAPRETAPLRTLQSSANGKEAFKRAAYRKRLLDVNAFYWLAARNRRKPRQVWIFLGFAFAWWFCGWLLTTGNNWFDPSVAIAASLLLNTTFKLWIALEAGHRLADDKRSGALELLLSSPLTVRDIIRGQWLALRRQFLLPLLTVAACEMLFLLPTPPFSQDLNRYPLLLCLAAGLLMLAADAAVLWLVAMHQALAARSPAFAGSATVLRVLVLPWVMLGIIATAAILWTALANSEVPGWIFYLVSWFVLGLMADAFFGLVAWRQLQINFRPLATARFSAR